MLHLRDAKGTGGRESPSATRRTSTSARSGRRTARRSPTATTAISCGLDVASGKSTKVDSHTFFSGPFFDAAWSPDSRWLAYTKVMPQQPAGRVPARHETGKSHQVTDGMSDARHPAFDKGGKYLYFTASTDIGPTTTTASTCPA